MMLNKTHFTVHMARKAQVEKRWSKKVFPYPYHRIYYIIDGEAEVQLTSGKVLLIPGYVYLLPAFIMLQTVCRKYLEHFFIHFQMYSDFNIGSSTLFDIYNPELLYRSENEIRTKELFKTVIGNYKNPSICSQYKTSGSLLLLLAPFFQENMKEDCKVRRFLPVIDYIEKNLDKRISNNKLAGIMKFSPVYFSNLFSKIFNISPMQYVIKKRLEFAQILLSNTDKTVKEISQKTGFESEMYFCRIFKKKLRITPLQYRESLRVDRYL
jgi:AraC family transcriptional regulator